jgi:hypothetical protein
VEDLPALVLLVLLSDRGVTDAVLTGSQTALAGRSAIIDGTAKNCRTAHAKLVGNLTSMERSTDAARQH